MQPWREVCTLNALVHYSLYCFVLRDEKDGFIEQDDLLNQDSFISGVKYLPSQWNISDSQALWVLFKSVTHACSHLCLFFLYRWSWHVSRVSLSQETNARVQVSTNNWHTQSLDSQAHTTSSNISGQHNEWISLKVKLIICCFFFVFFSTNWMIWLLFLGSDWWYPSEEPGECFWCSEWLAWFCEWLTKCKSYSVNSQQQVSVLVDLYPSALIM